MASLTSCTICDAPRGSAAPAEEVSVPATAPDVSTASPSSVDSRAQQAMQHRPSAPPLEPSAPSAHAASAANGYILQPPCPPPAAQPAHPLASPAAVAATPAAAAMTAPSNTTSASAGATPAPAVVPQENTPAVPIATSASAAVVQTASADDEDGETGMCVLCLDNRADSAVVPCGHMCGCHECLLAVKSSAKAECPMCRGPMSSIIRIYRP